MKQIGMTLIKGGTVVSDILPSFKRSSQYSIKAGRIEEIEHGRFKLFKIEVETDMFGEFVMVINIRGVDSPYLCKECSFVLQ